MLLASALRIRSGSVVAFTGAGGKSGAIARLASELPSLLITTTTRLGIEQSDLAEHHLVNPSMEDLADLPNLLKEHKTLLVTGPEKGGKWGAVDEDLHLGMVKAARKAGVPVVIEADGARGRSLKAPAEHEPVIPSFVDLVVPIAGLDAIGQTIDSEAVHRPERVAALLNMQSGAILSGHDLARIMTSPEGGLKRVPERAEVRALLTRATDSRLEHGRAAAKAILETRRTRAVVLAALDKTDCAREVHGRVAGVVLAAGGSSRLGQPKQLIEFHGRPLVWHAVQAARGLDPIVVVVGESSPLVRKVLTNEPVTIVENSNWEHGQSSSVRAGLAAVEDLSEAAIFLLADMPSVGPELVGALVARHRQSLAPLVAPWAGGRRANPVLFDRLTFKDLKAVEGDRGGRALFRKYEREFVEWEDSILLDIDKPADLQRLRDLE